MQTNKIYKRDANGSIRVWYAETDGNGSWRSISGVLNGNLIESEWRYSPAKSQADSDAQSEFEALAQLTKLCGTDYRESIAEVDIPRASDIKPMLAHKYPGWAGPCYSQPKLDGMRCLTTAKGLWSRGAKPIVSAPHIAEEIEQLFRDHPSIVLDGELYNHDMHDDFNTIMSIAKRTIISPEDVIRSKKYLQYHIYDMFDPLSPKMQFGDRNSALEELFGKYNFSSSINLVETKYCQSKDDVDYWYENLLRDNYEGQIIRFDKPYEQKRSNYLLKRKEFQTEEFHLDAIVSGEGNYFGYAKIANCRTVDGKQFSAGIKGEKEYTKKLLEQYNAGTLKYQSVTIQYFNMTPDGVPRFPVALHFNDGALENRKPTVIKDF